MVQTNSIINRLHVSHRPWVAYTCCTQIRVSHFPVLSLLDNLLHDSGFLLCLQAFISISWQE
jgi:hypothetical protein